MATLYITEYPGIREQGGGVQAAMVPALQKQTVAISGTAASPSKAFHPDTRVVRLHTDAICSVAFGTSPTATATDPRMAADQTEYFALPGNGLTVSVITNS